MLHQAVPREVTEAVRRVRDRLFIIGGAACFLLLVVGAVAIAVLSTTDGRVEEAQTKVFRKTLAEDLRVTRHGVYGVDFVKCRSCRLEKRKRGPLTFGGLNVLVMEGLSIVIPPDEGEKSVEAADDSPRSLVRRLGVSDGFLTGRGLPVKFSGLRISNLEVSRLSDGNRPELVFSAQKAEAVRGGLALAGCVIVRSTGERENVGKAMLKKAKQKLCLSWRGGEMDLINVKKEKQT